MPRPSRPLLQLLLCASTLVGCASKRELRDREIAQADLGPIPSGEVLTRDDLPIGEYLMQLNLRIEDWFRLKARGNADEERLRDVLEVEIGRYARSRREELNFELAQGPLKNRMIAAAGLGFTGDPEALGPLLAALEDPAEEVRRQAILGLGLLADADTPIEPLAEVLRSDLDSGARNNAAYALFRLVRRDVRGQSLGEALRLGLLDPEPTVRAQCAVALGVMVDGDAVDDLAALLSDDQLAARIAAGRALLQIARDDLTQRGPVAREFLAAWETAEGDRKQRLRRDLIMLAGRDLGDRAEDWRRWALDLP